MTQSPNNTPEKKALLEAFDTVLKTQAEERESALGRSRSAARPRRLPSADASSAPRCSSSSAVYLYVERPEWVFPAPAAPESLAVREASLRISVANAAQHVERYRQRTGRCRRRSQQAGATGAGTRYERTADGLQARRPSGRRARLVTIERIVERGSSATASK